MKRYLTSFLFYFFCILFVSTNAQTIQSTRLSIVNDSITELVNLKKYDEAISACYRDLNLLIENNQSSSPEYVSLYLRLANIYISKQDYSSAKYFYFQSFRLNETYKLGVDVYEQIEAQAIKDNRLHNFYSLLSKAKSDRRFRDALIENPVEVINSFNNIAWERFHKGDYDGAICYFDYELNLLEATEDTVNVNYLSVVQCIVFCLRSDGDFQNAYSMANHLLSLTETYYTKNSLNYAEALKSKAEVASDSYNLDEAISLYEQALEIYESYNGKENMDYIRCLRSLASTYMKDIKYIQKNIELEEQAKLLLDKARDVTLSDKSSNALSLSQSYALTGDVVKQLEYALLAKKYLEEDGQTNTVEYAFVLNAVCSSLNATNRCQEAIDLGKKSIEIMREKACTQMDSMMLGITISQLASSYFEAGNKNKAITILSELLSSYTYPNSSDKLSDMQKLVMFYSRIGDRKKEQETSEQLLEFAKKTGGENSELYANSLLYSAFTEKKIGDTMLLLQKALRIYQTLGRASDGYIQTLHALSILNINNEVYEKTMATLLQSVDSIFGKESIRFYQFYLSNLYDKIERASNYGMKDELLKLLEISETALQKIQNEFGKNQELYVYAERLLSNIYKNLFHLQYDKTYIDKSIYYLNDIVKYNEISFGKDNIKYIRSLEDLANAKIQYYEYYEDAYSIQKQIVRFYKRNYGKKHEFYAHSIATLGQFYYKEINELPLSPLYLKDKLYNIKDNKKLQSKLQNAIELTTEALDIYLILDDKFKSSNQLIYLYWMYSKLNDTSKASECLNKSFLIWKEENINQLSMLTSFEKNQRRNDLDWSLMLDQCTSGAIYNNSPLYNEIAYNAQLFNKSILLDSEIRFKEIISEMNDKESIDLINQMNEIQSKIQQSDPIEDIQLLNIKYQNLERNLMKKSQEYGDYMHNLNISFNDIKAVLKPSDIAIEFIATLPSSNINEDVNMDYYALTIASDYTSPHLIKICTDKDLDLNDSLYSAVWKPLENELKNKKNIYFAPTQKLHIKPIESAEEIEGISQSTNRAYYRLTSTRQLAYKNKSVPSSSAVLYGALQYSADLEALKVDSKKYQGIIRSNDIEQFSIEDFNVRSKVWNFLPGTLEEVNEVSSVMKKANISIYLYTDTIGTEASFKALDGAKRKFIHIATHGFYFTVADSIKMHRIGLDIRKNGIDNYNGSGYNEDNSLSRCGLLFAGCNNILTGNQLPDGIEDGVLFAKEISNLDLRGLDLITLSACETGLGDISGEGVFGLQRAFKKAGAQSILMSLWKVDDYATSLFMQHFYESLFIKGMTKTAALKDAQQYIKSQPEYESPIYWAGFVLLDALK